MTHNMTEFPTAQDYIQSQETGVEKHWTTGHGRILAPYLNRTCFYCHRVTYSYKGKYPQWRHDINRNLICKSCYDRQWRSKHPEHVKIYSMLYQPRANQLRRERIANPL